MKINIVYILIAILALNSCAEYDCTQAEMRFGLVGFSSPETDTVILRKYSKSTNFLTLIDTFLITPNNTSYSFTGDTLVFTGYTSEIIMKSAFDYEISISKAAKTFKLTKITEEQKSIKRRFSTTKEGCINPITSYELDGLHKNENDGYGISFLRK